jgi:hypothetical protein
MLEFDQRGTLIHSWGGPGAGYDWPQTEHGVFVDHKDVVTEAFVSKRSLLAGAASGFVLSPDPVGTADSRGHYGTMRAGRDIGLM